MTECDSFSVWTFKNGIPALNDWFEIMTNLGESSMKKGRFDPGPVSKLFVRLRRRGG
jgi:hypothetical protein